MIVLAFALAWMAGVRFNVTASVPVGFYVRSHRPGALAVVCPQGMTEHRPEGGNCPDGRMPLLKQIVARAGDRISFSESGLAVNGKPVQNSAPLESPHFPFGESVIPKGQIWLGTPHPRSFDSRYFGPVPEAWVVERVSPLLVW